MVKKTPDVHAFSLEIPNQGKDVLGKNTTKSCLAKLWSKEGQHLDLLWLKDGMDLS